MGDKKIIVIAGSLLALALLSVLGSRLAFLNQAEAGEKCHKINTTQTATLAPPFNTEGEVKSGILKGSTNFTGDEDSITPISGLTSPPFSNYLKTLNRHQRRYQIRAHANCNNAR